MSDPADHVPTGYVPRATKRYIAVRPDGAVVQSDRPDRGFEPVPVDHLSETIDRQLLIERKARAWDALRKEAAGPVALDMDDYLARS